MDRDRQYTVYTAEWPEGDFPEVNFSMSDEEDIWFSLSSEAKVRLIDSEEITTWGELQQKKYEAGKRGEEKAHPFEVVVLVNAAWNCDPVLIVRRVIKLKETISKRNLLIKNLRQYNRLHYGG